MHNKLRKCSHIMVLHNLSTCTQKNFTISHFSRRKFASLLKNENSSWVSILYNSNSQHNLRCINLPHERKNYFSSLHENSGRRNHLEEERMNNMEDDAYENNECVYFKKGTKFVIRKKRRPVGVGEESNLVGDSSEKPQNETRSKSHSKYPYENPTRIATERDATWTAIHFEATKNDNHGSLNCINSTNHAEYRSAAVSDKSDGCTEEIPGSVTHFECISSIYNESDSNDTCTYSEETKDNVEKMKNEALMKILTQPSDHVMLRNEKRFCDFLWILAKSGKGGKPNYNKRRSKKLKGEGYGGHGGNVILKCKKSIYDLIKIEQKIKANDGEDFKENSRGKDGKDKIIYVPVGTIVRKRLYCKKKNENNRKMFKSIFWYQFLEENDELLIARGGKGGISYSFFKKHDFRLPENSEKIYVELELRLMNDVAFIGIENSGKTSLCSSLSKYYGNINSEMFTTTIPHVSNINYVDGVEIALLDTPYLFYNAHQDKSRGKRILRHLYRSKLIVYVIDVASDKLKNVDDLQVEDCYLKSLKEENANVHGGRCGYQMKNGTNISNQKNLPNSDLQREKINQRSERASNEEENENLKDYYNDTIKQIKMLRNELFLFNPDYLKKKELVVATKCDMLHKNTLLNLDSLYFRLKNIFPDIEVVGTSAKFGLGIKLLSRKIRELIYPHYILQNSKLYSKHIEDYVIPTYAHFKEGKKKLQNYDLPDNIKHIYDHNYFENFDYFLKKKRDNVGHIEKEIKENRGDTSNPCLIDDRSHATGERGGGGYDCHLSRATKYSEKTTAPLRKKHVLRKLLKGQKGGIEKVNRVRGKG
ncbi:GTP-binding protein, putative [Plasmodium ovale curtisi]|uniref:GTP-binding protein, putative n=2 Tax=Plasmodium ovale TaxID=36330 RepID=A0A1A8VSS5_PLAOA|nr:GTP-binding protein, putative [Plasmodium ovale curtisi]